MVVPRQQEGGREGGTPRGALVVDQPKDWREVSVPQ